MKVKMTLLSDAIFGSGRSIPGGEDIAVRHDACGFPYIAGSTVKGVLREEMQNYFVWTNEADRRQKIEEIFGAAGVTDRNSLNALQTDTLTVSDFTVPQFLQDAILKELKIDSEDKKQWNQTAVLNLFTHFCTFTKLKDGVCEDGTLRNARCLNRGLILEGEIHCRKEDEVFVKECLSYVKWIGTMRTRGFGNIEMRGGEVHE